MIGGFGEVFLMDWGLAMSVEDHVPMAPRAGMAKYATRATAPLDLDISTDSGPATSLFGPLDDTLDRPSRR